MVEAVNQLIEAIGTWLGKSFNTDSGIMGAIENIVKLIVAYYVDTE
ncbi:MAG: hypothetical protein FWG82_04140 [Oscillospiraceae bacterium]|nr:hypothetical protein [Oscillospiraceae bacterium]